MRTVDVVVVGAGPAGSTAACLLQHHGFQVLLLDKSPFPRPKLCGGLLTRKSLRLLHRVHRATPETLRLGGVINYASWQFEVGFEQSLGIHTATYPFNFVDRAVFDAYLVDRARRAGADVATGEGVERIDLRASIVHTSGGRLVRYRALIGADGVNSLVRRTLAERHPRLQAGWTKDLATALELRVPRNLAPAITHPRIRLGLVQDGYAWAFPNRDAVLVGVGALPGQDVPLRVVLESYCRELGIPPSHVEGHAVPYGNHLRRPAYGNVIGDAAGSADPVAAEGIFFAMRTGELAARAIHEAQGLGVRVDHAYNALYRRHLRPELDAARRARNALFRLPSGLMRSVVKLALDRCPGLVSRLVHGDSSYRTLRREAGLHEGRALPLAANLQAIAALLVNP
jgi:geranylgeranyl reductase family protein